MTERKFNVIGIGEILWDMLPTGKILGGAPANFAYHAQQLGAEGTVISAVCNDELGKEIEQVLKEKELNNCLSIAEQPTGTVSVELRNGSPSYTIHEGVAWDNMELTNCAKDKLHTANAVCFGSLAQRNTISRKAIVEALEIMPANALKVFDINLRQHFYTKEIIESSLERANVFKINDEELLIFRDMFHLEGSDEEVCQTIIKRYNLRLMALTKGENGSDLLTADEVSYMKTPQVEVADTIGAGDSFTATLVMGLLGKKPLKQLHQEAVEISAFVCTQNGATPVIPMELKNQHSGVN